jgi:hypothetical protein|tara:strand:- start:16 stop:153 length:138 start_codon:yes stop_codon:yes gene_type:complete
MLEVDLVDHNKPAQRQITLAVGVAEAETLLTQTHKVEQGDLDLLF